MDEQTRVKILEDVRFYPSPHNSQPIQIRILSDDKWQIYYNLDHGLPAEAYGIEFGYVCTGVFLASLRIVAARYGYTTKEMLTLSEMDFSGEGRSHQMAIVTFLEKAPSAEDTDRYYCFMRRQTSRIPYKNQLVEEAAITEAKKIASSYRQTLTVSARQKLVDKVIAINQKTLFYELENDAVYNELMTWLRFSELEAKQKADGLSARTMLIPGSVLRFFLKHRGLWHKPIIGPTIKSIYLSTMRGVRQVAWITGPFNGFNDYIQAGKCFLDIWVALTKYNIYLHPYGTVITNPRSHAEFTKAISLEEKKGEMAWMLFRLGYSNLPPKSYRRSVKSMLLEED